jgi:hypothetical protein
MAPRITFKLPMTPEQQEVLGAALALAGLYGISVFPCRQDKRPYTEHGFKDATRDEQRIEELWRKHPGALIGTPTGPLNGYWVLDVDKHDQEADGSVTLAELERQHGALPPTRTARTPSGGMHKYFKWDAAHPIGAQREVFGPGLDVRGNGGYVISPPSVLNGTAYTWDPACTEITEAPSWLYEVYENRYAISSSRTGTPTTYFRVDDTVGWSFAEEARLRSALSAIPADEKVLNEKLGSSHDVFVRIGMAIQRLGWGERGYAIFRDWCSQCPKKFDEKGLRSQWNSFERNRDSPTKAVTVGTVFYYARQLGWNEQRATDATSTGILPDPIDLWAQFDPPELPQGILPAIIEDFARERAEIMGADPAGLALGALTVGAAAIPDRIKLQVKKRDQAWREAARLWVALIGLPSTKKSPIIREVARPLIRLDTKLLQSYLDAKTRYDKLSKEEKKAASAPPQVRLRIEDITIEAAQEVLKDSPDGVLSIQDELAGFFGSMDKYSPGRGAAKDRGFWLQSYNGGSYAVNRIDRGVALIPNLSISILGGIQPEPLRQIIEGTVDDGLIQRLLPLVLHPGTESKDVEPTPVVTQYATLIDKLRNESSSRELLLHFDDGAQAIRQRLECKHLDLAMSCERLNKKLAAHLGKYDGVFARLCLIWHCIEHAEQGTILPVTEHVAHRVEQFMHGFLFPHALAFYAGMLGMADDQDRLTAVASYILARRLAKVTNRDIARGDRSMRRLTKRDTAAVFEQLEALGWLMRTAGPRPTDPPHWMVNPRCHEKFAERAKQEAERRQRDREFLATAVFGG